MSYSAFSARFTELVGEPARNPVWKSKAPRCPPLQRGCSCPVANLTRIADRVPRSGSGSVPSADTHHQSIAGWHLATRAKARLAGWYGGA